MSDTTSSAVIMPTVPDPVFVLDDDASANGKAGNMPPSFSTMRLSPGGSTVPASTAGGDDGKGWTTSSTVRLSSGVCVAPAPVAASSNGAPTPPAAVATVAAATAAASGVVASTATPPKSGKGFFRRFSKDAASPRRSRRLSRPSMDEAAAEASALPSTGDSSGSAAASASGSASGSDADGAAKAVTPPKSSRKALADAVAPYAEADAKSISAACDRIGALLDTAVTASATAVRQVPALELAGVHAAYMAIAKYLTAAVAVQRGFPATFLLLEAAEKALRSVDALQSVRLLAYRRRVVDAAAGGPGGADASVLGGEAGVPTGTEKAAAAEGTDGGCTQATVIDAAADGDVQEDADLRALTADYAAAVKGTLDAVVNIFPSADDGLIGRWQKRGAVFISSTTKAAMVDAARALEAARLAMKTPLVTACAAYDAPDVGEDGRLLSPAAASRFD